MKIAGIGVLCFALMVSALCHAASESAAKPAAAQPASGTEAGPPLPDAPAIAIPVPLNLGWAGSGGLENYGGIRPFSTLAVAVKVGLGGVGFDLATPLSRRMNLRGGASFFNYNPHLTEDGIGVDGTLAFRTVSASVDIYPFGGGFRMSPGVVVYNGNHIMATASVPGGQSFTLNEVSYTSSPTDPVSGTFDVAFGHKAAPSFTVGFGNMIPRSGRHWSMPFEIGFEYTSAPQIALSLTGTACSSDGCSSVQTDPATKANIQQEQAQLNSDISPLRFYPIASLGLSFKF